MRDGHVAVNLLWCIPGDVGGSEEYLVRQLVGLGDAAPQWRPTLYVVQGFTGAHPELAERFPTVVAPFDGRSRARRIVGETTWMAQQTSAADLRHHGGGTSPVHAGRPYVLTIHDLQHRTYPGYVSRHKRAYLTAMIGRSVRRAAMVAVPSDYVRASVIDAFAVEPQRVMVVPHGFDRPPPADITAEEELRRRYSLGAGRVIVYPAVTHPHKNHRFLVDLMATTWRDPDLRLVLTGGTGAAEADVSSSTDQRIRRLGRVPVADRNGMLAMADALVFPSQYEGFGAPLIEAMALGCPVVAANSTCIPAIVGDAGLVLPLETDAWGDALARVAQERPKMIAAGLERAAAFTVRASGAALAAVYSAALQEGKGP